MAQTIMSQRTLVIALVLFAGCSNEPERPPVAELTSEDIAKAIERTPSTGAQNKPPQWGKLASDEATRLTNEWQAAEKRHARKAGKESTEDKAQRFNETEGWVNFLELQSDKSPQEFVEVVRGKTLVDLVPPEDRVSAEE